MKKVIRSTSDNPDFTALVLQLDKDLAIRDGEDHSFYAQYNKVDTIKHVVIVYEENLPVGCGAFKYFNNHTVEIKRMFVLSEFRKQGIAKLVLTELENWAATLNYTHCILETGKMQPEAIGLYLKMNYNIIPNYGQYEHIENSVCMSKELVVENTSL